jgi:DMSO/TMAO reductase YedYZ molybdopterin-dependent catalytic subunit
MAEPTRRELFKVAVPATGAALLGSSTNSRAHDEQAKPVVQPTQYVVRMQEPRNLEVPASDLPRPASHFVRSHFAVPQLDAKTFTLTIDGHVEKPVTLTLADIQKLPKVAKTITLECAGNGRIFLVPQVRGLQWAFGGVSQAEWGGVTIADVLALAKPKAGAVEVLLSGADKGAVAGDNPSPGPIHFDRSIPLEKALKPECLLAYEMNGKALRPAHGYPLRAVLGGWYGMAAIKWLNKITVVEKPYDGFWQTMDYAYYTRSKDGSPSLTPVTKIQPKAVITSLGEGSEASLREQKVVGVAWAGEELPKTVEFSDDGGATWQPAKLVGKAEPFRWVGWEFNWKPKAKGVAKLVARCTDSAGTTQPDKRDPDRRTYMINHLVPIEVTVE